jgi:glycosyltransferase involved in cell wall biosynthesis
VPIRVAVVADVLLTPMGGVARSVLNVTRELARLDPARLSVTVVAARRPDAIDGIPFRASFAPRAPKLPDSLFALQRPFTLRGYDLVHYMDSRPPLDFPLGRIPTVVTQHGFATLTFGRAAGSARRWVYVDKALLRLAPHADLTLTASESERSGLLAAVPIEPDRVVAIHHGVEHERFLPPADREATSAEVRSQIGIDGRYVLYVSNHQRKKNTERLVEAFARVAAAVPDVSLVLTGWHTPRFRLVQEVIDRLGLQPRIKVLGHVPDELLTALYQGADVFALPSLHEGFGLPILEAMACGTPVVTSDVYALPEVAGDAAELVDPYDTEAIAAAIIGLLMDRGRANELRARGVERAASFTWRRSAERHFECYERVVRATVTPG